MLAWGVKRYTILLYLLCQFGHSSATLKGIVTGWNPSNFHPKSHRIITHKLYSFTARLIGGIVPETEAILLRWQSSCQGHWAIRQSGGVNLAQGWKESKSVFYVATSESFISTVYCLSESHFRFKWWLFLHTIIVILFLRIKVYYLY